MKNIYLIGAGGHCVSCIDVIKAQGQYQVKGIFDVADKVGSKVLDIPVVGTDEDISKFIKSDSYFLITVGQIKTPQIRISLFNKLKEMGAQMATVISPRAYVSDYASVGPGAIVMHDVLVNANVHVGSNCILNTKSLIEHDAVIESHCHISTAAVVNGNCRIGEGSFVGSNAVLKEGISTAAGTIIPAGSFYKGAN